jgi:hypothetical protein
MSEADSIFRNTKRGAAAPAPAPTAAAPAADELPAPAADAPRDQVFEYAALLGLLHAYGAPGATAPTIVGQARRLYLERWGGAEPAPRRGRRG